MGILVPVFIIGFLIRLIAIDQSLWLDETIVANVTGALSIPQILTRFTPTDFHPPLYYLFIDLWVMVFGNGESVMRLPSVLFSIVTAIYTARIGYLTGGQRTRFWAAVFILFNPLFIYYSQEARMYMMVTMFFSIGLFHLFKLLAVDREAARDNKVHYPIGDILMTQVFFALTFGTFYASIFGIAAVYLFLLIDRRFRLFRYLLPGPVASVLVLLPLLFQQYSYSTVALQAVENWHTVLGTATIRNLILIPIKFTIGRVDFEPTLVYYPLALSATAVTSFFILKGSFKSRTLLFLLITPIILAFIASFIAPMLTYFRFLYLMPVFAVLLAHGVRTFGWEQGLVGGIVISFSLVYLLMPQFHREDWKHLLNGIPPNTAVFVTDSARDPLQYYYPTLQPLSMESVQTPLVLDGMQRLVVVPYAAEIYGIGYQTALTQAGFTRESVESVHRLEAEYWVRE